MDPDPTIAMKCELHISQKAHEHRILVTTCCLGDGRVRIAVARRHGDGDGDGDGDGRRRRAHGRSLSLDPFIPVDLYLPSGGDGGQ